MGGQLGPALLLEHLDHAGGKLGGSGEFGAEEGGDLRFLGGVAADLHGHLAQSLVAHDLAADQEGVTRRERGGEALLHLAQRFATAVAFQPHLERVGILYGPDIHTNLLARARVAQLPLAVGALQ